MKEARAIGNYIRVAPRKARLVIDLIRGRAVDDALAVLSLCRKGAAPVIRKVLVSAMANTGPQVKPEGLVVSSAYVDEGPTLKRYMPRAMGRATPIRKRTCRITIVVREQEKRETAVKHPAREAGKKKSEAKGAKPKA